MFFFFFPHAPVISPQPKTQAAPNQIPERLWTIYKAGDWPGIADWFETASPDVRGRYYETWLRSLDESKRWDRLLVICDAILPQLEAKTGPKLSECRQLRARALYQLGRHEQAAQAYAENGRLGDPAGFFNACNEARLALDWPLLLSSAEAQVARIPGDNSALGWKAEALIHLDRFEEAEPILRQVVAKDPKFV